jgi:glycosyltransferase involved in cell wall biosynthesis
MPKASIIITTHDRPNLLPHAVESARQAGSDIEIVVVDDASLDETAEVCRGLGGIKYVRLERNQRVAGARNAGLVASSGEYLSFLDDDDVRLADSLDHQIEMLEKSPDAALIYGQAIVEEGKSFNHSYPRECPQGDIFWQLLGRNFIPCGSVVFRRSCLSSVGLLDSSIPGLDDWDLWVRIAEIYPIMALATPVIIWRRSTPASGQGTSEAAGLVSLNVRQFRNCWMNLPRSVAAPKRMKRVAWRNVSENMAEHLLWESARSLRRGKPGQSLRNLAVLPRLSPLSLMAILEHRILRVPHTGTPDAFGFVV